MTLFDLLDAIPRFVCRHMFAVYVETHDGNLLEVDKIATRSDCTGVVLITEPPPPPDPVDPTWTEWDDDFIKLRDEMDEAWLAAKEVTAARKIFDPACTVIAVETAYRLLEKAHKLLNDAYER